MARADRSAGRPGVEIRQGDVLEAGLPGAAVDVAVAHAVSSRRADPARVRPGGVPAVCDGDHATTTVAPQAAIGTVEDALIHAPHVMRRMPAPMRKAGALSPEVGAHRDAQTAGPDDMPRLIRRGLDAAFAMGEAGPARGVCRAAVRRAEAGRVCGALRVISMVACKPG